MKNKNFKMLDKKLIRKTNKVIKCAKKNGATSTNIMSTEIPFAPIVVCNWGRGCELRVLVKFSVHGDIISVALKVGYEGSPTGDVANFSFRNCERDIGEEVFLLYPALSRCNVFNYKKYYKILFSKMPKITTNWYSEAVGMETQRADFLDQSLKFETERANSLAKELRDCSECWKTEFAQVTCVPESPQMPVYRYPWGCS